MAIKAENGEVSKAGYRIVRLTTDGNVYELQSATDILD